MREDMAKVIVERPRRGAGWARKGRAAKRLGDYPFRENGRYGGRTKFLNENLAPLERFLHAQVNRPWNKVYSEIRARIKPGNTVQEHVLTHIPDMIRLDLVQVEPDAAHVCGLAPRARRWFSRPVRPGDLYVDTRDGIIKKARRKVSAT
jgi:hypothetical protein